MDPATEQPAKPGSHYQPSLTIVLVILVAFIAGAFLILRTPAPAKSGPSTVAPGPGHHVTKTTVPPPKSQVRVQVANGTSVSGLAREYTQQLLTIGWDTLPQLNGPRVSATEILFNPGYQWAARLIAREIKVPFSSVRALGGQTPVSGAASDDVVVILGPNAPLAAG